MKRLDRNSNAGFTLIEILLAIVLARVLFKPLLRVMRERADAVSSAISLAENATAKAQSATAEFDAKVVAALYGFVVTNTRYVALEFGIHGYKPYPVTRILARCRCGETITIDAEQNLISVDVSPEEMARRRAAWTMPPFKSTRGTLAKYIRLVKSASEGCVTDE